MLYDSEFLFVGFDCAYRTLGWCILGYNPRAIDDSREIFHLYNSGVADVLEGCETIAHVAPMMRARKLASAIAQIIPRDFPIDHAHVIIEKQPRKTGRGIIRGTSCETNQNVEAQLLYHFAVTQVARSVYLVSPVQKNKVARALLREEIAKTYAERKKQVRRAFLKFAQLFNFSENADAHPLLFRNVRADMADACVQIIAAILLCAKDIDKNAKFSE
jgi:hypothetical protein